MCTVHDREDNWYWSRRSGVEVYALAVGAREAEVIAFRLAGTGDVVLLADCRAPGGECDGDLKVPYAAY